MEVEIVNNNSKIFYVRNKREDCGREKLVIVLEIFLSVNVGKKYSDIFIAENVVEDRKNSPSEKKRIQESESS